MQNTPHYIMQDGPTASRIIYSEEMRAMHHPRADYRVAVERRGPFNCSSKDDLAYSST
jgi:hypothetical protein